MVSNRPRDAAIIEPRLSDARGLLRDGGVSIGNAFSGDAAQRQRFFLESLDAASERLKNFVEKAAKATLVGDVFDDAATGQGLLNYFLRAINCGAITEAEAANLSGLTLPELHSASFVKILKNRQAL